MHSALRALRIGDAEVEFVSDTSFNTFFGVGRRGRRFALRRGNPVRIHVDAAERIEATWLDHLADDGWSVPRVVEIADVDGLRWTLFEWVDGSPVRDDQRADDPERLGEMLALLHDHAAAMPPIDRQEEARFDRVLFLPADDLVSGHDPMCADAVVRVQETLDELWAAPPHDPHLLHGDLGWNNVLRTSAGLVPLDFQDLRWGFAAQDLAISLADCDRWNPGWPGRVQSGYAAIRPLPDLPDAWRAAWRAGRSLDILNLGLHLRRSGFDEFWERHAAVVRAWMTD